MYRSHLLIVEDDDSIRTSLRMALHDDGYRVTDVADADTGVAVFAPNVYLTVTIEAAPDGADEGPPATADARLMAELAAIATAKPIAAPEGASARRLRAVTARARERRSVPSSSAPHQEGQAMLDEGIESLPQGVNPDPCEARTP